MRTGVLSDEYTKKNFPAFFPQPFRKGRIQKPGIPFFDLYQATQVTMDNPYAEASEMVLNYVPPVEPPPVAANLPLPPVNPPAPSSPQTSVDPNNQGNQNLGSSSSTAQFPPLSPQASPLNSLISSIFVNLNQHGTMIPENPPRSMPNLRPDSAYTSFGQK